MKITHLISASLVAATTWAKSSDRYAFFVKNEGKLEKVKLEIASDSYLRLAWDHSTVSATEFLYENGSAFFNSSNRIGRIVFNYLHGIYLGDDTSIEYTTLSLDNKTGQVLNFLFYSCEDSNRQVIGCERRNDQCFNSDLYFMKIDTATKEPLTDLYDTRDVKQTPRYLYVRDEDGLEEPIYAEKYNLDERSFFPFYHGKSDDTPVEVVTQRNLLFAKIGSSFSGYFDAFDNLLGLSDCFGFKVTFDDDGILMPGHYFSCKTSESEKRQIVTSTSGCSDWKEVKICFSSHEI